MKFFNPISTHFTDKVRNFRICCIKFRHHTLISKTLIIWIFFQILRTYNRKMQSIKPVFFIRLLSFLHNIFKRRKMPATMVKYTINNNPNSIGMKSIYQFLKISMTTKTRIYMKIIQQIIFMIFSCRKYRIDVNCIHTKILKIVYIFGNTINTAPKFSPYDISIKNFFCFFPANISCICSKTVRKNIINY